MKRAVDLKEISDGKLYRSEDMVRADCRGCNGCSKCCQGMGKSIVLDPLDVHRLVTGLNCSFEELLKDKLELNVVDGLVLPNLKLATGAGEQCAFLNQEGRCSIHKFRPGICRLFPLGRYYTDGDFYYFLQIHECPKENKTKIKVKKWIDTPDLEKNERFIRQWHYFLKDLSEELEEMNEEEQKTVSMHLLKIFYLTPYLENRDFYEQVEQRMQAVRNLL